MDCKLVKNHIHQWIDEKLDEIMEIEVTKLGMKKQDFVAVCIVEKLGISLNDDYMMDETQYTEIRIQEMEKEMLSTLRLKKQEGDLVIDKNDQEI